MFAATKTEEDVFKHHSVGITGGLASGTIWQLEGTYHWFPCKYIGLGASIGMWKQIGTDYVPATQEWRVAEDSRNMSNGYVMPSVVLVSPTIFKTEDVNIGVMVEPGFMMNIGYNKAEIELTYGSGIPQAYEKVSCNNGRWYAFNLRIGVFVEIKPLTFSLGYVYSNLDIYAMRRNMIYRNTKFDDFYPRKKSIDGMYLKAAYSF